MPAIDDAVHKYIGESPGTQAVVDSAADARHGVIVDGAGANLQWVDLAGRDVLYFPETSTVAGSTENKSRVVIPGGWSELTGSFSFAFWFYRDMPNNALTSFLARNGGRNEIAVRNRMKMARAAARAICCGERPCCINCRHSGHEWSFGEQPRLRWW